MSEPSFVMARMSAPPRSVRKAACKILAAVLVALLMGAKIPAAALAGEKGPAGFALRPLPLLMPMDYAGARAQAWLHALEEAAGRLPAAAERRLADLGLDKERIGGDSPIKALAGLLFPVDVITPQLSSSREIFVYLKNPADFSDFSRFFNDEETLALGAALILEMKKKLDDLADAWPVSLNEARDNTAKLEEDAAWLEALWQARNMYDTPRDSSTADIEALALAAPESMFIAYLLAGALLAAQKPQQCLQETNRLIDNLGNLNGEEKAVWNALKPRIRSIRALAQWRLNQLALAQEDLNAAIHEAAALPARTRAKLLELRGSLKMERDDRAGMCADFAEACGIGFCRNLARARRMGSCQP